MTNEQIAFARTIQPGVRKGTIDGWRAYALVVREDGTEEPVVEVDPFAGHPKSCAGPGDAMESARDFVQRLRNRQHRSLRELAREAVAARHAKNPTPGEAKKR